MSTHYLYPPREPVIIAERAFNAPRALVWDAFTKPEHLVRWWGPHKYETIVLEHDLRVGGKWRMLNRNAKVSHEFFGEILELKAPERLVQTFSFRDFPPVIEAFTLAAMPGDRTKFEALMRFDSIASRDGMVASGMESGAEESYAKLDALLAELAAAHA